AVLPPLARSRSHGLGNPATSHRIATRSAAGGLGQPRGARGTTGRFTAYGRRRPKAAKLSGTCRSRDRTSGAPLGLGLANWRGGDCLVSRPRGGGGNAGHYL